MKTAKETLIDILISEGYPKDRATKLVQSVIDFEHMKETKTHKNKWFKCIKGNDNDFIKDNYYQSVVDDIEEYEFSLIDEQGNSNGFMDYRLHFDINNPLEQKPKDERIGKWFKCTGKQGNNYWFKIGKWYRCIDIDNHFSLIFIDEESDKNAWDCYLDLTNPQDNEPEKVKFIQPSEMVKGEWYVCDINNYEWVFKFNKINSENFVAHFKTASSDREFISYDREYLAKPNELKNIRKATRGEVGKYFPNEFVDQDIIGSGINDIPQY